MKRIIPALIAVAALALPGTAHADTAPVLVFPEDSNGIIYVHTGQSVALPVRLAFASDTVTPDFSVAQLGNTSSFDCSGNAGGGMLSWTQHSGLLPEPVTILCGTLPTASAGDLVGVQFINDLTSVNQQDLLETKDLTASLYGGGVNYLWAINNFDNIQVKVNRWVTNSAGTTVRRLPVIAYTYSAGINAFFKWNYRNNKGNRVKAGTYHMHVSFNSAAETSNSVNKKVKVS